MSEVFLYLSETKIIDWMFKENVDQGFVKVDTVDKLLAVSNLSPPFQISNA